MTVKELISKLQEMQPDSEVRIQLYDWDTSKEILLNVENTYTVTKGETYIQAETL